MVLAFASLNGFIVMAQRHSDFRGHYDGVAEGSSPPVISIRAGIGTVEASCFAESGLRTLSRCRGLTPWGVDFSYGDTLNAA